MRTAHFVALGAVALALAVGGCSSTKIWMKSGGSAVEADSEEMDCAAQSESGSVVFSSDGASGAPPVDSFSKRYSCLRSRGYKLVTITNEESAKLNGLSGVEKDAYYRELMTKYGVPAGSPVGQGPTASPPAPGAAPRGGSGDLPPGVTPPRR